MSKSRKRKNGRKNLIILVLVLAILAGLYYYINVYMKDPAPLIPPSVNQEGYTLLENQDSLRYIAVVTYANNVNINTISNTFYKNSIYWPYIFIENKNVEGVQNNPLDIPKGAVLKIPRLSNRQLDPSDITMVSKVKNLADSILSGGSANPKSY